MRSADVTRFLHSGAAAATVAVSVVCAIAVSYFCGDVVPLLGSKGLGLPSANEWLPPGQLSLWINLLLTVLAAFVMCVLNRAFNLMRDQSVLVAMLFMLMQMSVPSLSGQFYGGTLMAIVVLVCTFILFSSYADRGATRRIYLIFFILGLGAFTQYAYLLLMPVFLLGCVQMRMLSGHALVAILLGCVTAPWILFGFGIVDPAAIEWPEFDGALSLSGDSATLRMTVAVGVTALVCTVFGMACMLRTYSYNSRGRSFNGFIYILSASSVLLCCADFTNITGYVPLLNCCAAYQCAHFFVINRRDRSYIAILSVVLCYVALYVWTLLP